VKNGMCAETDYPYTSKSGTTGTCRGGMSGPDCTAVASLTGHQDVESEDELVNAVNIGPVSVAIEADKTVFQSYKSGVIDSIFCGKKLDHGVLVVGHGHDGATMKDYWKVKNSWDTTWGEEGYVRIVRGKDMCGIASGPPSYPTGVGKASLSEPEMSGVQFDRTVDSISKASALVTFDKGCTKSDTYGSNECTFNWGDTVSVNYDVSLEEDIDDGATIDIDAKVDNLLPFKASCKACGANCTLTIPIIKKKVSFAMPDCPIKAAELKNVTSFTLPDKSPVPISASVKGTVTATDQSGTVVAKVDVDAKIGV